MKTKFDLMRAGRNRWHTVSVAEPVEVAAAPGPSPEPKPEPFMTIKGVRYVERPDESVALCGGCAFSYLDISCRKTADISTDIFGGVCGDRNVIYIKAP